MPVPNSQTGIPTIGSDNRSTVIAARSVGVRWMLAATGFVIYFVLGIVVLTAIPPLADAVSYPARLAFGLVPGLVAAIRGATITAEVRPDGIYIRNRWRQQTIPWSHITSVNESASIGYTIVLSIRTLLWLFRTSNTHVRLQLRSSLLAVHRHGHRFGIPLYATLGSPMADHQQAFRTAIENAGAEVLAVGEQPAGAPTMLPPPTAPR